MNKDVFNMPNPVTIMGRSSSITNSFVNGIIPVIEPSDEEIREALKVLGQDENDVRCVYCGDKKTEWDHLYPLIMNKKHTGYITEIANLVPACGKCNQSKGNSDWKQWMLGDAEKSPKRRGVSDLEERIKTIENYDNHFQKKIINLEELAGKELWDKYQRAYDSIIFTMESAQKIMDEIKQRISPSTNRPYVQNTERPKKIFVVNKSVASENVRVDDNNIELLRTIWDSYEEYLIDQGYKKYTPSGYPSTAPQYKKAVIDIFNYEGITLQQFCASLNRLIEEYDVDGIKAELGARQHSTWINALKRFRDFLLIKMAECS